MIANRDGTPPAARHPLSHGPAGGAVRRPPVYLIRNRGPRSCPRPLAQAFALWVAVPSQGEPAAMSPAPDKPALTTPYIPISDI